MPRSKIYNPYTDHYKEIESFVYNGSTYIWGAHEDAYYSKLAVRYYEKMPKDASIVSFKIGENGKYWHESTEEGNTCREWIPCSERMPTKEGYYLITHWYRTEMVTELEYWDGKYWLSTPSQYVTAWMPIPDPYKK